MLSNRLWYSYLGSSEKKRAENWILLLICAEKALKAMTLFSVPKSHYPVGHAEDIPLSYGEPTHCALAWEHQWFSEQSSRLWNAKCSSLSLICVDMPQSSPLVPPKCLWWNQWVFSRQPGMEWTHRRELERAGGRDALGHKAAVPENRKIHWLWSDAACLDMRLA